ncbi:MAG: hypothetical protein AB8W37_03785 [Arsenophonus endosymbiont of Dermacentor nuttalli]
MILSQAPLLFIIGKEGNNGGAEEAFAEAFSQIYDGNNRFDWPNIKSYILLKNKVIISKKPH